MEKTIFKFLDSDNDKLADKPAIISINYNQSSYKIVEQLNYFELKQKVLTIAAWLQKQQLVKKTVILIFPAGHEFAAAFLGCLSAGVIAIPVAYPNKQNFSRINATIKTIKKHSKANIILTTIDICNLYKEQAVSLADEEDSILIYENIIQNTAINYKLTEYTSQDIAYLQYSSGSTSQSKGIITTYQNLFQVLENSTLAWKIQSDSVSVNWTPHSHVYGLVCGLLLPLYNGNTTIIMSPDDFIYQPLYWLEAIADYQATYSGCPNFGYEYCIKKFHASNTERKNSLKHLDSWQLAISGGELVEQSTMQKFYQTFKKYGFRTNNFCSAYGMSEATGLIATTTPGSMLNYAYLKMDDLTASKISFSTEGDTNSRCIISSGLPIKELQVQIVDPDKKVVCSDDSVGEICLAGPTISPGYWQLPDETKATFNMELANVEHQYYFRTGDLGFIKNGEIFLTGRLKELINIYGKKYYPKDIEKTITESHVALNTASIIVFSYQDQSSENLVTIVELPNGLSIEHNEVIQRIRRQVAKIHGLDITEIVFVNEDSIPKTASGKIQRRLSRQLYLDKQFIIIHNDSKKIIGDVDNSIDGFIEDVSTDTTNIICKLTNELTRIVAKIVNKKTNEIDKKLDFFSYGIDSIGHSEITLQLGDLFDIDLSPAVFVKYDTIELVSDYLLTEYAEEIQKFYAEK